MHAHVFVVHSPFSLFLAVSVTGVGLQSSDIYMMSMDRYSV